MDFGAINYLAVILSAVAICILGSIWYSPKVFWNTWQSLKGLKQEDLPSMGKVMTGSILLAIVNSFLLAIIAGWATIDGWVDGLWLGLVVGLVIAGTSATNAQYEGMKLKLYLITAGFHVISMILAGIIIGSFS
ncbi:DUF1761 domain-containing protein [Bacillus sp. Marseille-P3661]|uniref:DUF1761 domain-containing protein n=1 Tax=Bacillus sp. Marseille-P3661 TaxID=1936234 RepID=UPI0021551E5C|nr:DUF1761 domain-containing protein [Bacillus sp. Marseille-P3661]